VWVDADDGEGDGSLDDRGACSINNWGFAMPAPSASESAAHLRLKQLTLVWAQANGYSIAGAEVSMPNLRARLDVAAYRPGRVATEQALVDGRKRKGSIAAVGLTAVFECKVSRPDYLRDSRALEATRERLGQLAVRKARHEETLRLNYPSIRNGDSLFQEYETLNFERPGCEFYLGLLAQIRKLSARLHANTKFEKLAKWQAANLYYVVAEPELFRPHELPAGWGLLLREGDALTVAVRPVLHAIEDHRRLALLHRIATAGTRATNAAHGIVFLPETRAPVAKAGSEGE
jgi:hypothetical protein